MAKAEAATGAKYNNWPTTLEVKINDLNQIDFSPPFIQYFAKDSDHVVLTHVIQVQNDESGEWYETFIDANTGDIVNVVSFVADASVSTAPLVIKRIYSLVYW